MESSSEEKNVSAASTIKWHEVTWYSKLGAVLLFLGVVPALCFYIGMQYQAVKDLSVQEPVVSNDSTSQTQTNISTLISSPTKEVSLSGKLIEEEFYGPPNYGENPQTDSKEHMLMLILSQPVNIQGSGEDPLNQGSYKNVSKIQLAFSSGQYATDFVGKNVHVSGVLFDAHTGHHHTPVLLDVKTINQVSNLPFDYSSSSPVCAWTPRNCAPFDSNDCTVAQGASTMSREIFEKRQGAEEPIQLLHTGACTNTELGAVPAH